MILVYVDHTSRFRRNTGIQRCVRCLSRALIEQGQGLQPVVWDRMASALKPASLEGRQHLSRWSGPTVDVWADSRHQEHDPREILQARWLLIPELVSGPHNPSADDLQREAQRLNLRVAWLFHDAIPLRWRRLYGAIADEAVHFHSLYMAGLAGFELVLANSASSAEQLASFWSQSGIQPRARLTAVPLATELPGEARLPAPSPQADLVLCVSSLEPRKNHCCLLKALAWLVAIGQWPRRVNLVLVGWANDARVVKMVERALTLNLPMRWEQDIDDARLTLLYQRARCCVFPSFDEGFGLPVAESLWHRRPCLCSSAGALGELAAGGGCVVVNTSDWWSMAGVLHRLVTDDVLHNELLLQIDQRQPRLWKDVARDWTHALAFG